jgi:hypothetical protein
MTRVIKRTDIKKERKKKKLLHLRFKPRAQQALAQSKVIQFALNLQEKKKSQ